jgi:excisionase family DNA binding protein
MGRRECEGWYGVGVVVRGDVTAGGGAGVGRGFEAVLRRLVAASCLAAPIAAPRALPAPCAGAGQGAGPPPDPRRVDRGRARSSRSSRAIPGGQFRRSSLWGSEMRIPTTNGAIPASAPATPADALMTAREVAALLRVTTGWVYAATRRNAIPHMRLGRYVRYRRSAIEAWMVRIEQGPPGQAR